MEDAITKIVIARLRRWEGQPVDQKKLEALREEIYSRTKTNKFAPFSNIKKWIKNARKEMAKRDREAAKKSGAKPHAAREEAPTPRVPARIQESMNELKTEMVRPPEPPTEVSLQKAPIVFDKVYLQTMTYELSSMRQALDRIHRQLDKLERELNQHRQDD